MDDRSKLLLTFFAVGMPAAIAALAWRHHEHSGREHKRDDDDRFAPISRTATILDRSGATPIPDTTKTCVLEVWSRDEPDMCQAWVTCEGQRVYGSKTSYTKCESTDEGPTTLSDTKPTPVDKDARLEADFAQGTMTLSDTSAAGVSYSIRMHIEPACVSSNSCPPLTVKKRTSGFIDFVELPNAKLHFSVLTAPQWTYDIELGGYPTGTTVTLDGKTTTISIDFGDEERADLGGLFADVAAASAVDARFQLDPHVAFELHVPGHAATTVQAPGIDVTNVIRETMVKAIAHDQPILFPHESAGDAPRKTHSIFDARLLSPKIYGPATTMRDVDWVAIDGKDGDIVVVDRKTTKIISRKASGDAAAIETWLRAQAR